MWLTKRFRKRLLCLALCLSLPLSAAVAEPVSKNLYILTDYADVEARRVATAQSVGDSLYLLMCDANGGSSQQEAVLERWTPGMDAPEAVLEGILAYRWEDAEGDAGQSAPVVSRLFTDGAALYGYGESSRNVYRLADANGAAGIELLCGLEDPYEEREEGDGYFSSSFIALFVQDGALVGLTDHYGEMEVSRVIERYDMETGKLLDSRDAGDIISLCPYKDGKLLAATWPEAAGDAAEMPTMEISAYTPETGELQALASTASSSLSGLAYSSENDTAYYVDGATVYAVPGVQGEGRISAFFPVNVWTGSSDSSISLLDGGMMVFASSQGAYVRRLDAPGVENGALTIYGGDGGQNHTAVVAEHPEMNMTISGRYYADMEQLTTAMVSGESDLDVLFLDMTSNPVSRLIDKGYAADLSAFSDLMDVAQRMDRRFVEPLMRDGRLYGLPVSLNTNMLGVSVETMKKLGLSEDELPTTWLEFLDFAANFYYDYGEENPDVVLLQDVMMRSNLFSTIMEQYVAAQLRDGGSLAFDTPLFRSLMQALEAVDFTELDLYETLGDDMWEGDNMDEFYQKSALFATYASASPESLRETSYNYRPLALSLDADMEPVIPARMRVAIINPRSSHMDQAGVYLSAYARKYRPEDQGIMFFPDQNDPVPNRYYEVEKLSYEESLAELDDRIERADESEKAALKEQREWQAKYLEELENNRMSVTAEMIKTYRETLDPYLYPLPQTPLTDRGGGSNGELASLMQQYLDKAIDLDTYIRETDKRVRMMMLEDK